MSAPTGVDVPTARSLIETNPEVLLVDVRTPGEFAAGHIPGAVNLPLDQVNRYPRRIAQETEGTLLLICQTGGRARQAQRTLTQEGRDGTLVLEGGMAAWTAASAPVASQPGGRPRWALDRQVRLVAGGVVTASLLVGLRLPRARLVAGFVGAGLVFSAVTGTCAMGAALAKLPYNRDPGFDLDKALALLTPGRTR
ncbi:rhodanese-like domain-containing protein [Rhizohabitans arisaemae]|uniref:rhodanese-like domain-containing protein n=1 Tax=Rhizohabitans arisaemae TaxID=2720610 RepID=UPI0024B07B94|nr:rhodanese-like domain-containing protein [Rhizohabitans arisaemae]